MRVLKAVLVLCAVWFLLAYLGVAVLRLRTPYELEWMEGGMVDHVRQVMAGHDLYRQPSLHFTPYLYTPLYYYASAAVSWVIGVGYVPLRVVSLASSTFAFGTVGWWVAKETADRWAGLLAGALLAACFQLGGNWYDLARVDSLFLALVVAGLAVSRFARSRRGGVAAGVLMVLAVLTKQEALLPAAAPVIFLWRRDRSVARAYVLTVAIGLAVCLGVLQLSSGGWFSYYALAVPLSHKLITSEITHFWTKDMLVLLPATAIGIAGILVARRRATDHRVGVLWFYAPVWVAMIGSAWSGRVHSGGYDNVLQPAFAITAVIFGVGLAALVRPAVTSSGSTSDRLRWLPAAACVLAVAQFALLVYNPSAQLPRRADHQRAKTLLRVLHGAPGPVYMPGHGWYLKRAGRSTGAQTAALSDVLRGPDGSGKAQLRAELDGDLRNRRFGTVVVESFRELTLLPKDFGNYYCRSERIFGTGRLLLPVTGTVTGPAELWIPRQHTGPGQPKNCPTS